MRLCAFTVNVYKLKVFLSTLFCADMFLVPCMLCAEVILVPAVYTLKDFSVIP